MNKKHPPNSPNPDPNQAENHDKPLLCERGAEWVCGQDASGPQLAAGALEFEARAAAEAGALVLA